MLEPTPLVYFPETLSVDVGDSPGQRQPLQVTSAALSSTIGLKPSWIPTYHLCSN